MRSGRLLNQTAQSLRRNAPNSPASGSTFLIVTEGKKTEPIYLNAIANHLQYRAVDVEIIHPNGTDPVTLTEIEAIRLAAMNGKKLARKGLVGRI